MLLAGHDGFVNKTTWTLAQLIFPLFLSIAVVGARARSVFALPFLVVGLWKMGFPETCSGLVTAHLHDLYDTKIPDIYALARFMSALGTVFHHSATAWFVCVLITGTNSPEGPSTFYMAVATPLIFQHWMVLTKYFAYPVFAVAEIGLEVWWEVEVITAIHKFRYWHEQRTLWGMLVAHWLYFAGAGLSLAFKPKFAAERDDDEDDAEVGMMKKAIRKISAVTAFATANTNAVYPAAEHSSRPSHASVLDEANPSDFTVVSVTQSVIKEAKRPKVQNKSLKEKFAKRGPGMQSDVTTALAVSRTAGKRSRRRQTSLKETYFKRKSKDAGATSSRATTLPPKRIVVSSSPTTPFSLDGI